MQVYERQLAQSAPGDEPARSVLFVTDGSSAAQAAIDEAIHLARSHDVELVVLYVVDSRYGRRISHLLRAAIEGERLNARRLVREALEAARRQGVTAHGVIVSGRPGDAVCRAAERFGAELVVMRAGALDSGRGLTDESTSDYVLRHSASPVCLVGSLWQPGIGAAR